MASSWDDLDASAELEQTVAAALKSALDPRGFDVVHNGSSTRHAAGGRADIEVRARDKSLLVLVELTKRRGAQAEGEFVSTTDHLDTAAAAGGYAQYGLLFAAPSVGARLRRTFLEDNRRRAEQIRPGRSFMLDFAGLEMLTENWTSTEPSAFPGERLRLLFDDSVWPATTDDAQARQVAATQILPERADLLLELEEETLEQNARIEQELKRSIKKLEDQLRDRGITGDNANKTLIYLTFMRLFEEKRVRDGHNVTNRMSGAGFRKFAADQNASVRSTHANRLVSYLLEVMRAEDPSIASAGLLGTTTSPVRLHANVTDKLVDELVFKVFDEYDFVGGRLDILGVVFETLARRAEKDTRVGQFFTPEEVVKFCADIVELKADDRVLDPAVGTARFLIAAMERLLVDSDRLGGDVVSRASSIKEKQLHGTDIDEWVASIAKMNMYIHGDGKSNVSAGNGLILADRGLLADYPSGLAGEIDVVLTNPPLGDVNFEYAAHDWQQAGPPSHEAPGRFFADLGVVPTQLKEELERAAAHARLAKIEGDLDELGPAAEDDKARTRRRKALRSRRSIELGKIATADVAIANGNVTVLPRGSHLKGGALFLGAIQNYLSFQAQGRGSEPYEWRGGRVVIVLDEAILNTPAHASTRAFLREHFFIKAVISLGRPAFKYLAHTDAKTSIVFAIKKPDSKIAQQEPVFYCHAERVGYSATGTWIGSDLPGAAEQYNSFRRAVRDSYAGPHLQSAALSEKVADLASLGVPWYSRPIGSPGDRLDFYEARREELEKALSDSKIATTTLGELIVPRNPNRPPASRTGDYDFAYIDRVAALLRRKGTVHTQYAQRSLWLVEEHDIVVSGIDLVHGAVAVAGEDTAGLVMSQEMFPFRVRQPEALLPEYAALMIRSPQTRAIIQGAVTGTSNRTRIGSAEELLDVVVPLPPSIDVQRQAADNYRRSHEAYFDSVTSLADAESQVEGIWPATAVISDESIAIGSVGGTDV